MKPEITDLRTILSKKEFKRFGNFINSPFFNTEERFIKVYVILSDGNTTREDIAAKIFGKNTSTGDLRFRKLVSEFMKLFNRFLSELELDRDDYRQRVMLVKQFSYRNLKDSYRREAERTEESLQTGGIKDEEYYMKMLELYNLRYQTEGFNYNSWKDDHSFKINEYLDKYFASMKLFLYQRYQSIEYIFHSENKIEKSFLDRIIDYIHTNSKELVSEYSDINLRYLIYKMIENPDKKELLDEYLSVLALYENNPKINCKVYYEDLINYYTLLVNLGKGNFEKNIFQIANIMNEKGHFNTTIVPNDYRIIIEAAIGLKEYDWAEKFAELYKSNVNDLYRDSVYSSCMGKINFFKKEYGKARKYLTMVNYDDYSRYAEAKLIECRILYEEKNISELLMIIETANKYLKSHKEIGVHIKGIYSVFLTFLKEIAKLYEMKLLFKEITYELQKLEAEVNNKKDLIYAKLWIIEKISELKKAG